MNLNEYVKDWPVDEKGWSVAPSDIYPKGLKAKVGKRVHVGSNFKLERMIVLGDDVFIGDNSTVGFGFETGSRFIAGDGLKVGEYFFSEGDFTVGINFTVGDDFYAGRGFNAGDNATGIANLGFADETAVSLSSVNGVAYIGTDRRWFTLQAAIDHWSHHYPEHTDTLCLLEAAKAYAKKHKLSFN